MRKILLHLKKMWLAYVVGIAGILLSCLFQYIANQDLPLETPINIFLQAHAKWFPLLLGVSVSILMGIIVGIIQVAQNQTKTLKIVNDNLEKEITERINAEEGKQQLEIALLQGQKLQSIGTLAGGIAHDFNNILYAIIGYVEMSREDVPKDSLVYKNLGKVLDAAHSGQELISRILAFSRRQQHHDLEVIDLNKTLDAALALLKPTIPASVIINTEMKIHCNILGNQTQIHQVLVNLINNAVDAMDGEGQIYIRLSAVDPHDPVLKQFPETTGQKYCKIEITDTGHGMDQHMMERIFEPFFTTKEVGKGTGLGLSIVHSIIKEHKGEINVKSQLGYGTTFTLILPEYLS